MVLGDFFFWESWREKKTLRKGHRNSKRKPGRKVCKKNPLEIVCLQGQLGFQIPC